MPASMRPRRSGFHRLSRPMRLGAGGGEEGAGEWGKGGARGWGSGAWAGGQGRERRQKGWVWQEGPAAAAAAPVSADEALPQGRGPEGHCGVLRGVAPGTRGGGRQGPVCKKRALACQQQRGARGQRAQCQDDGCPNVWRRERRRAWTSNSPRHRLSTSRRTPGSCRRRRRPGRRRPPARPARPRTCPAAFGCALLPSHRCQCRGAPWQRSGRAR
jgi:hypothetical protein